MAEFNNVQEAYENLRQHELQTNSRYAAFKVTKDFGKIGLETAKKVFWEDPASVLHGRINFSGTPYVIIGRKLFDCQFGKNRKEKRKLQKDLEKRDEDHRYTFGKKFLMQDSKKIGCPARCVFREICRFPTFTIDKDTPKSHRRKIAEELLSKIRSGENVVSERVVIAHIATIEDHTCHNLGEITPEPIDPRLAQKIAEMCQSGVTNLDAMRTLLNSYVKDICRPLPHPSNKRFYPSDKCISNHMYRAKNGGKKEDQQAVVDLISEWQKKPGDFIYYRVKSSETLPNNDNKSVEYGSRFLFIYQSAEQKRLLQRYGSTVFLDATYKTTLYDLPLFFLAVKTNVDYQVVATFLTEDETIASISEALQIIRSNLPEFQPAFFMTDFDESSISAVENVFTGVTVLICDFHRNQAWERWTRKRENSLGHGPEIRSHLQKLATASNVDSFEAALQTLQTSELWMGNCRLQNYLQKVWLPHKKRWTKAYRQGIIDIVASTNNGIESHHRVLKKSYMHGKTTFNLTSMLKILINEFFPARYRAYVDKNQEFSGKFRKYSNQVPVQLHRRPRQFIRHCLQNVELSKDINPDDVKSIEGDFFTVVSGKKTYRVSLGGDIHVPFCDCIDWYKFHMPCKHMIAIISSETDINWQRLSTLYMQSVYCTVDDFEDITDREADNECETSGEVEINGTKEANTDFEEVTESKPDMADECEKEVKETSVTEEAVKGDEYEVEQNNRKHQVMARESLKKLMNMTYNITDNEVLNIIQKRTNNLIQEVLSTTNRVQTSQVPLLSLPKRLTKRRLRKRLLLRKGLKGTVTKRKEDKADVLNVEVDGEVDGSYHQIETDQFECVSSDLTDGLQSNSEHCIDEEEEKVRRLWALPQNFNIPVAKVYDVCVTDTDIRSLKDREWLTDNVIDTYLKILTVELEESGGGKCLFLVSSTVGQIMNKTFHSRTSYKLSDYKLVVGAYIRASHWTLVVLDMQKEIVYFYNPVEGAEDIEMGFIKSSMCGFIAKCNQENEADVVRRWRVDALPHSSQTDSFNCGVYCLLFAEKHLHGEFGDLTRITFETLKDMRLKIGKKMMLFEVYIRDSCPKCGMNIEEQDQKLQCDTCGRSYHFKPYCVEDDINSLVDGDTFSCTLCRYNYWKCQSEKQCIGNNYQWIDKDQALNDLCENSRVDEEEVMIIEPAVTVEEPIVNKGKRILQPRNMQKRKRTSFLYQEVIKKKKSADEVYCVCRRKYKKSDCMWCCDSCNEWFHPKCIGRDDQEEPPRNETSFLCKSCLTEQLKEWPVDEIESYLGSTVDEEDLDEKDFLIKMEEVQKHMREAYARCWYLVRVEGNKSSMHWMKRHIMFTKQRGLPHSQGFGEALFSPQAICMIKVNLRKRFQKLKDSSKIYSLHYVIPDVANEDLKSSFEEETGQSENYIYKVLVKEAMITIMQKAIGEEYENVDLELQKTEGKNRSKCNSLLMNYIINDRDNYIQLHKRN